MKSLAANIWAESLKVRKSKLLWLTIGAAVFFTLMIGVMVYISRNPDVASKLGLLSVKASILKDADWPSYLSLLNQLIAGMGAVGFGFVTAWVFGREYSDRTVKDLLALPFPRSYIVLSKFVMVAVWSALLALIILLSSLAVGWLVGLPGWSNEIVMHNVYIYAAISVLTILMCTPVAFFASYGRGYIPPIGFFILTIITAQFVGVLGLGPYFPWAIPGLYAVSESTAGMQPGLVSLAILALTSLIGLALTLTWWRNADQY